MRKEAKEIITALPPVYQAQFTKHKACVLVPTYNNAGTLAAVLDELLQYTHSIIVVNDGSTDDTASILRQYPQIKLISYSHNKGKGFALRTGIKAAAESGYEYAITIDSDGQHYPKDLIIFLDKLDEVPGALIVGARNMDQVTVPGKSNVGNKFSNFWYWMNTGETMPDTQSGYRLYPVQKLAHKKWYGRKYEFEVEVIVRASWMGIPVVSVPVSVYYPKPGERVTHFRPFKDFVRIGILHTFLVIISLLWIRPRNFFKRLASKEGWASIWRAIFFHPEESNHRKAASIGFGVFMGIVPIWGFQLAVGIPLSILFRLNKALFILAIHISVFPLTAFFWMASLATGKWLLGDSNWHTDLHSISLDMVKIQGKAFFLGGSVLAVTGGLFTYLLTYSILFFTRRKRLTSVPNGSL